MACLDKSSCSTPEHKNNNNMYPRISFSNDFAESQYLRVMRNPREKCPPASVDFEFSVSNNCNMLTTADELFFKGQLLPFKPISQKTATLKEELLLEDDHDLQQVPHRRPKRSSTRWMSLLGLKKSHITSKKTSPTSFDLAGTVE